jgi:CDP-glucose 4,6-dehydratase
MNLDKIFYKKKIIITGHTGFKGSWLTAFLKTYGAKIYGISDGIPTKPSHFISSKIYKNIETIKLNVCNKNKIEKVINSIQPDFIFHLAAQSLVSSSFDNPYKTWSTNVIGSLNILNAIRKLKKKCSVVMITSDKCYVNINTNRGYNEEDRLGGDDPYSASKASAEILIHSYIKSYFKKKKIFIATARAGNVIGGGDWAKDRLIPDCMRMWFNNKIVKIRNPQATRPWQHVLDAIYGYIVLAAKLNYKIHGQSFNFGPLKYENYSVNMLLNKIKKKWILAKWVVVKRTAFKEAKLLRLNCNKSKKILSFNRILNFEKTTNLLIQWYREYYNNKKNVFKITIEQINYYKLISKKNNSIK